MKRAIVFGVGNNFIFGYKYLADRYEIVGLADNSGIKQGRSYFGHKVARLEDYGADSFDVVIVTPNSAHAIREQLLEFGINDDNILSFGEAIGETDAGNRLKIAVILYGGMGDFIIGKNWLYHLKEKYRIDKYDITVYCLDFEQNTIKDIFSDCRWISKVESINYSKSELVAGEFDCILRFCIFPYVQNMNDEKVFRHNREFYKYVDGIRLFGFTNFEAGFFASPYFYKTVREMFEKHQERKYHSHFDVLGNLGAGDDYLCEISIGEDSSYLRNLGLKEKEFITIDTGVNREYSRKPNTRAWRIEDWGRLAILLKKKYPEFRIVQMGLKIFDEDDIEADINLNGKTSLEQAKILMKNAFIHIDYDGGLIHLRHVLKGGPSVVLYGPSAAIVHNYPENVAVYTDVCASCEWTSPDWLSKCPKGYSYPKCMETITPELVMEKIDECIEKNR